MAEAFAIATDLGFPAPSPQCIISIMSPVLIYLAFSLHEDQSSMDNSDDLVKVLRELTVMQRNIANLQVELQGRKVTKLISNIFIHVRYLHDDKNIAHLTHVSEMEKKCESLARITTILKDVIQNKDCIIARLQQPYSLDCIPVEAEYQEMLRPIPAALASCTRFFEAMSAMRESFSNLQKLRVGHSSLSMTPSGSSVDSKYLTPPSQWRETVMLDSWKQVDDITPESYGLDGISHRMLSWPSSLERDL
ncbi:hypothetical protein PR202_ga08802 [Eleusine coracana subsp. coracana]|uniref:Uncharacterized protein n=1 Tax=Eleusine coracana subsp. coracana TaxID=191504 RepID=A0AAV5C3J6_ELECO|nr:hypothetical protein PR202_ga08802 [Eleusine coracana subsp. coracana]